MPTINLLPWREIQREQVKKRFLVGVLLIFLITILVLLSARLWFSPLLKNQQVRQKVLQQEIALLTKKLQEIVVLQLQRKKCIAEIVTLQQIQKSGMQILPVLLELSQLMPAGLYLTQLEREKNSLLLLGQATSNVAVSLLMKKLKSSKSMEKPLLEEIKQTGSKRIGFKLGCKHSLLINKE